MSADSSKQATPTTAPPSPNSAASPKEDESANTARHPDMPSVPGPGPPLMQSDHLQQHVDDSSAVLEAATQGNVDVLGQEGMLEVRDGEGNSPLLAAVRRGSTKTVVHLVKKLGADLGHCNNAGMSCLHLAAERSEDDQKRSGNHDGHASESAEAMLLTLLDELEGHNGCLPEVDARDNQRFTPLHVACMCGDVAAARCLLRRGADVGATNDKGSTPVHWACSRGHTKVSGCMCMLLIYLRTNNTVQYSRCP